MKINILTILFAISLMPFASCGHKDNDELGHHHHHHDHAAEAYHHDHGEEAHHHDHDAEGHEAGEIVLEPEVAEQFGVKSETIAPGKFSEVISATGEIVDSPSSASIVSAPTSGILTFAKGIEAGSHVGVGTTIARINSANVSGGDANAYAKATFDAAQRELERVKPLYELGIVAGKDYNEALQAFEQAKAAYSSAAAAGIARSSANGVVTQLLARQGEYVDVGAPIATVSANQVLTIKIDLPASEYRQLASLSSAKVQLPYSQEWIDIAQLGGKQISASANSAQQGYIPVYFSIRNNGDLLPGSFLKAQLLGREREGVISVPSSAISEQQGVYFVYQQLDEECYKKLPVKLGQSDGHRTEVLSGLRGGEDIVVEGMIAVRLAESSGVAPEGHSHNH